MSEEPTPTPPSPARRAWQVLTGMAEPSTLALLAAAGALAIVGAFGGFNLADDQSTLTAVAPGETVHVAPLDVTVLKATYGADLKPAIAAEPGYRTICVSVRVRVADGTLPLAYDVVDPVADAVAIDLPGLKAYTPAGRPASVAPPAVLRVIDARRSATLQPGLTYDLIYAWQQKASEPAPTTLTVTLAEHTWRASSLTGRFDWLSAEPARQVTLAVTERKGS